MQLKKFLAISAVSASIIAGAGVVAQAASDNLTMNAVIVAPITIDCTTQALNFGNIDGSGAAGTVVVSTTGTFSNTGGSNWISGGTQGQCTLGGSNGAAYDITFAGGAQVDDAGAGAPMGVGTFVVKIDAAADDTTSPYSGTFTGANDVANIGATLTVGAAQVPGSYTGTVAVTAVYQ